MDDERLKRAVKGLEMPADMRRRLIEGSGPILTANRVAASRQARRRFTGKRAAIAAASAAICLMVSLPVLAASVPAIYDMLYVASPATAQFFKPVNLSCEDDGIYMEVISAYIHGDTAEIYMNLQDLTGDRVDETTDLFDQYSLNTPFGGYAHCENVGYDGETRTATFLISVTQWEGRDIEGDKITFCLTGFLSGKESFDGPLTEVDLSGADSAADTFIPDGVRGWSGIYSEAFSESISVLSPSGALYTPADGAAITAVGYVDGLLHVQVFYENIVETDNHRSIYFQNASGEIIRDIGAVSFWDDARQGRYTEYVFSIPQADIESHTMYGNFHTSGRLIRGDWTVTFPVGAAFES